MSPIDTWPEWLAIKTRQLYESGKHSAGEISRLIGCGKSRNAIIGKAHRDKWINPNPQKGGNTLGKPRRGQNGGWRPVLKEPVINAPVVVKTDDMAIPMEQRKTLFELEDHHCHWPVGEPGTEGFFFCGAAAQENKPYCVDHMARASTPRSSKVTKTDLYRL